MAILARKLKVEGDETGYVVGLWVGEEGCQISVTEDDDDDGDVFGFAANHLPLEDMLAVCRKVRRLAKWAETPKGRAKIAALFDKETNALAKLQERDRPKAPELPGTGEP